MKTCSAYNPVPYVAPIAFDASSSSVATAVSSVTLSHTCAGINRILFVGLTTYDGAGTADLITGVTYNGSALTLINKYQTGGNNGMDWLFYIVNPSLGANNIVVSSSKVTQQIDVIGASYTGASQTGIPDASATGDTGSSPLTISLTTVSNNCWVIGQCSTNNGAVISAGTGTTQRVAARNGSKFFDSNGPKVTAGSTSLQVSSASGYPFGCIASFAPVGQPISTKAYYPLNGNSTDYSGNGNNGTDTAITYPQGKFGQAAKFDGSTSGIASSNISALNGASFLTYSCWVNPTALGSFKPFMSKEQTSDGNNRTILGTGANATGDIWCQLANGSNSYGYSSVVLNTSRWYHLVMTFDGTQSTNATKLLCYVNGVQQTLTFSGTIPSTLTSSAYGQYIGVENNAGGAFFNGLIDEVIIESRALTPAEVSTYYRKSMLNYGFIGKNKGWLANLIQTATGNFFNFFN